MRRLAFFLMAGIVGLASICGCSVKEDRNGCPCRLFLDMTGVDMTVMSPLSLYVASDGEQVFETLLGREDSIKTLVMDVPRSELSVTAWGGGEDMVSEQGLKIPMGSDCPRVYMHSSSIVAEGDHVRDTVVMRKNHCVLTMLFSETEKPFSLVVRGSVAGYDASGDPVQGDFQVPVPVDTTQTVPAEVVLPRQTGGELYLDLADCSGNMRMFPLHEYIDVAGYDWTEPDLKDLKLTLDYTLTAVTLIIQGWDEEFVFDIVI